MPEYAPEQVRRSLDLLYRADAGRILATLVRLLGDLDLAEDSLHEAFFSVALTCRQETGIRANPRPWLISTARLKAIDTIRRRARFDAWRQDLLLHCEAQQLGSSQEEEGIEDDRLRLIFTCCHPSLAPEARVALTLRELADLRRRRLREPCFGAYNPLRQRARRDGGTV